MRTSALALVLGAALLTAACDETLYNNLSESDANEMLVTLLKRGVAASKVAAGDFYAITVPQEQLVLSLEIIGEHKLPREQFQSLGSVFAGQGMIASQTEEQARLAYAISQELSDTLSRIDGVLDARVHVVLVQHEQSSGLTTPPSAAIFIRHTKDSPVESMAAEIKDLAAKAVPGLTYERVSIVTELFTENVRAPQQVPLKWYQQPGALAGVIGAGIIAAGLAIFLVLRRLGVKIVRSPQTESTEQKK